MGRCLLLAAVAGVLLAPGAAAGPSAAPLERLQWDPAWAPYPGAAREVRALFTRYHATVDDPRLHPRDAYPRLRRFAILAEMTLRSEHDPDAPDSRSLCQWVGEVLGSRSEKHRAAGDLLTARRLCALLEGFHERALRFNWERNRFEECQRLVTHGLSPSLRLHPLAGERHERSQAAWRARHLLQALIRRAGAAGHCERVSRGWQLLGLLDYYNLGQQVSDPDAAFFELRMALSTAEGLPAGPPRDRALRNAAAALAAFAETDGDLHTALQAGRRALELAPSDMAPGAWKRRFRRLLGLGGTLMSLGLLDAAFTRLESAETLLNDHRDDWGPAIEFPYDSLYAALGNVHRLVGAVERARGYYEQAAETRTAPRSGESLTPRAPIYHLALAELGRVQRESEGSDPAQDTGVLLGYGRAAAARRFMGREYWISRVAWQAEARYRELLGDHRRAAQALRQARLLAANRRSRLDQALCDLELGQFLLRHGGGGGLDEARDRFRQALAYGHASGYAFVTWQALLGRAMVRARTGDRGGALADLESAARLAEQLRQRSALPPEQQARMLPESAAIYERAALLSLTGQGPRAAYLWVQRARAHSLRQHLPDHPFEAPEEQVRALAARAAPVLDLRQRLGELAARGLAIPPGRRDRKLERQVAWARSAYEAALARLQSPATAGREAPFRPLPVEHIERLARDLRLNLVEYLVADGELWIFCFAGGPLRLLRVRGVPLRDLRRAACRFTTLCAEGAELQGSAPEQLRRWLLAPLAPHLLPGRPLIVVPDGPLHGVPFAALPTGGAWQGKSGGSWSGAQHVIEERAVGLAPSLDAFYRLSTGPPAEAGGGDRAGPRLPRRHRRAGVRARQASSVWPPPRRAERGSCCRPRAWGDFSAGNCSGSRRLARGPARQDRVVHRPRPYRPAGSRWLGAGARRPTAQRPFHPLGSGARSADAAARPGARGPLRMSQRGRLSECR